MTSDQLRRALDRPDLWADRTRAHAAADTYARRAHELEVGDDGSEGARDAVEMLWIARTSELDELAPSRPRERGVR